MIYMLAFLSSSMAMLLSKFRIDYSDLVIITDVDVPPKSKTKKWFDDLIRPLLQSANNGLLFIEYSSMVSITSLNYRRASINGRRTRGFPI